MLSSWINLLAMFARKLKTKVKRSIPCATTYWMKRHFNVLHEIVVLTIEVWLINHYIYFIVWFKLDEVQIEKCTYCIFQFHCAFVWCCTVWKTAIALYPYQDTSCVKLFCSTFKLIIDTYFQAVIFITFYV